MSDNTPFDLTKALAKRTSSPHTERAYYRWVDQFLVDLVGMQATRSQARIERMQHLPVSRIVPMMQPDRLDMWLHALVNNGHNRQSIDQARASVVALGELLADADHISASKVKQLKAVSAPIMRPKARQTITLNRKELGMLMASTNEHSTSHNQMLRNTVVMMMLCMMALRREELASTKWSDLQRQGDQAILSIGKSAVQVPPKLLSALSKWRDAIGTPDGDTPLIRRIWKGGSIAKTGLSPDGIWLIVKHAADSAGLGNVSPDDLRRSVAGGLRDTNHSLEEISRLLRHKNTTITERYLNRIPQQLD
jgi:integrase